MRTHLFRGAMALAVLLTVSAVPALAQSVVRGKVVDAQGKAVADATVLFEATDANAVVCARGVYRAGCAGPNAAVVVRKPVPVVRCTRVLVNGVYVKRCV